MRPMEALIRLLARMAGGAVVAGLIATSAMADDDYDRPVPDDVRFPAKEAAYGVLYDDGYTVQMQSRHWFQHPARCSIRVAIGADFADKLKWQYRVENPETKITDLEVGFERHGGAESKIYHAFYRLRIVRVADATPLAVERLVFVFPSYGPAPSKSTARWSQHPIDAEGFAGVSIDMNKLSQAELQQFTMNSHLRSLRFAFDLPELGKSLVYFSPGDASNLAAVSVFAPCACAIGHPGLAKDGWLECAKYPKR